MATALVALACVLPLVVMASVVPAPAAAGATTQAQLIQRLRNTQAFLQHPVDPQDMAQLPGSPYSAILAVLTPYVQSITAETSGGASLTAAQLTELGNVDQVLSLVVARVATTGAESPMAVAQGNANITTGEWGIAYETSLIMGTRFVGIAANLGNLAMSVLPVWEDIQGAVANGADSQLLNIAQDLSIQTDQYLAWAVQGGSSTLKEALKSLLSKTMASALSLQVVGQGIAHQIADLLLSLNGYLFSPYVADAILIAESRTAPISTATVQQVLSTLHGPASVALWTYDQLQATFTYGPVHSLLQIVDLLPFVGSIAGITQDLAAVGGNIGGNAVDALYLFSTAGIPDPHLLTDTLLFGWTSGVGRLLGQELTPGNSEAASLTLEAVSPLPGWCTPQASGVPRCQLGSQVGFHGEVTNALGQPVAGARVAVSTSGGSVETATVITNASGAFADGITLPTAAGQTAVVTAQVPGGSAPAESLSYQAGPGPLYQVELEGARTYPAGSTSLRMAVLVLDAHGNLIPNQPLSVTSTVGSVTPSTTTSGLTGYAKATVTFPAGTMAFTVHAAVGGSALSATFPVTVSSGPTVTVWKAGVSGFTVTVPGSVAAPPGASVATVTWTWGDGTHNTGPFPQEHAYSVAGTYTVSVTATDSNGASGSASSQVVVSAPPASAVTVSPTSLPGATVGVTYSTRITISGGISPYKVVWTSLPPGLVAYTPDVLSGAPTQSGSYGIGVTVTDSSSPVQTAKAVLRLTVGPAPSVSDAVSFRQETSGGTFPITTCTKEPWLVTLDGVTESCAQQGNGPVYVHFHVAPGSYPFTVSAPSGMNVSPASGVLTVATATVTEPLSFTSGVPSTGWTESVLPDHTTAGYYQTLACSGTHCYQRGVVHTGTHTTALALWASSNGGRTWSSSPFLLPGVNLVQSCGTGGTGSMTGCLAAVGPDAFALGPKSAATLPSALWSTSDSGVSWSEHQIGTTFYGALLSCPTSSYCAVAGNYNGTPALFVTTDGGTSWSEHPIPGLGGFFELSCPQAGTCLIAGAGPAMLTTDSGVSWAAFGPSASARAVSCPSVQTCWESTGTRVLVTDNAGATWASAGTVGPGAGGIVQLNCLNQVVCTAVSAPDVAYATADAATWTRLPLPSDFLSFSGAYSSQDAVVLGVDQGNAPAVWTAPLATVVNAPTTTSAAIAAAAQVGQSLSVPVRVQVAAPGPGVRPPQGQVVVMATASTGTTQRCTATVAGATGVGTGSCPLMVGTAGTYSVTASYGGAAGFRASSSGAAVLTVSASQVSAVVTVPPAPVQGQSQTVAVRLMAEYAGPGVPAPSGSVKVSLGKASCTATVQGATGDSTGSCTLVVTTSGVLTARVTFMGGGDFAGAEITGGQVNVAPARTPAPTPSGTPAPTGAPSGGGPQSSGPTAGYDLVGADGGVFVFSPPGTSGGFYGSLPGLGVTPAAPIVGMVPTTTDRGYFLVGADGGVFSFGNAPFLGSLPGLKVTPAQPITGIVAANTDTGYFLVGRDGGVYAFGQVPFLGSLPGMGISVNNIIGIAATPSGNGYWLVGATGAVYAFGAARHLGTAKGTPSPVAAIAGTPTGGGYWITTKDGAVYAYGNAGYHGSLPDLGVTPALPVIGIVHTADTQGYWLIGADGGIFAFGDAGFVGSLPGLGVHVTDIVGAVPTQS